jgi:diguanylate cyclase (GGDEF)-like protein
VSANEDERLLALAAAGRALAATTTLDELYPLAARLALEVLGASSASVARIERDHGLLRVLCNVGRLAPWEQELPADETYEIGEFPFLAATVEEARPWTGSLDDRGTGSAHRELLAAMGMHSSVSVPVIVGATVWGEVGAARTADLPRFGSLDVAAGEAFCGMLAAALARIEDRDELHALAYRDGLTGLGNRRAVDERLELLFSQETLARPVTVILCDVNGLKTVNDQFGHDAGDRLLREVGTLLTLVAGSFPGALAARLGGDEFCLLLEGESQDAIDRAARELTAGARTLPFGDGLSCGWASATRRPGSARTPIAATRALLRLADAAQYRAKRAGRAGERAHTPPGQDVDSGEVAAELVTSGLGAIHASRPDVESRLTAVVETVCRVLDGAAWAVSASVDRGPVTIVRNLDAARFGDRADPLLHPGVAYDLDDYPETAAALLGGTLFATIDEGDDDERAFLAANGYDELVGAGAPQDGRVAWLVELCGDAMTLPLQPYRGPLQAMVSLAVAAGEPVPADVLLGRFSRWSVGSSV